MPPHLTDRGYVSCTVAVHHEAYWRWLEDRSIGQKFFISFGVILSLLALSLTALLLYLSRIDATSTATNASPSGHRHGGHHATLGLRNGSDPSLSGTTGKGNRTIKPSRVWPPRTNDSVGYLSCIALPMQRVRIRSYSVC